MICNYDKILKVDKYEIEILPKRTPVKSRFTKYIFGTF